MYYYTHSFLTSNFSTQKSRSCWIFEFFHYEQAHFHWGLFTKLKKFISNLFWSNRKNHIFFWNVSWKFCFLFYVVRELSNLILLFFLIQFEALKRPLLRSCSFKRQKKSLQQNHLIWFENFFHWYGIRTICGGWSETIKPVCKEPWNELKLTSLKYQ